MSGLFARVTSSDVKPGPGAYEPKLGVTSDKLRAPAYTLKGRHGTTERPNTAPYRDLPSSIGSGPKISLASRHATRDVENTPGPGYIPPALGSDAPKVAMSYRHGEARDSRLDNPGPGAYDYKAQFGNEAPKSTMHTRTGDPMGINSISPGPGAYNPDYSTQKKRAPSATMHIRPESRSIETSPGPSDYQIDRSLGGPKATMHARTGDPMGINSISPGPGAYNPTDSNKAKAPSYTMKGRHESTSQVNTAPYRDLPSTIGQGPKISLASRHATRDAENTPGPNYIPPALGADAPKVAMSYRHGEARDSRLDNPGPGAYDYKAQFGNEAPKSTMHSRNGDPMGINSISPGPAAYNPDYSTQKARAPSATMHIRPESRSIESTPGPSDYQIDRSLGGQKSTMHTRTGDPMGINSISPGPGAYNPTDSNKSKAPSYTMKGRHESVERPNTAPYRDLPSTIGQGPKISLASRHATRDAENTPGPNYIPPALGADAPKVAMSYRHGEARDSRLDNPGPGAYDYKTQFGNEAPKATMHTRTGDPMGINSISPGPGAYNPDFSTQKKRAPSATMHIRPESRSLEVTPGPSDYQIDRSLGGQASTMHARTGDPMGINSISPGPGAYNPGDGNKAKAPSFTMKGRHESTSQVNTAPYRDLPSTIGQGPKISLASRHATRDVENTPGPNYIPPALGADAPKVAMSYRHGEARDSRLDNPGPGAYDYKAQFGNEAPKSTMHTRNGDPMGINSISPGPAAYSPDYNTQKTRAPSATMHIRPESRSLEVTPGPSDYQIDRSLGGQKSTMHTRTGDPMGINSISPGPGAYNPGDGNKAKAPSFTMKGRHESVERPNTAPYRDLPSTIGQGPKISLASRHATRDAENTPGPNYIPPALGADAPKVAMSYRHGEARDSRLDNPGPGAYDYKTQFGNEAPKATMHTRTGDPMGINSISPGPGAYNPDFSTQKKRAPSATMHIRPESRSLEVTPGPSDYQIDRSLGGQKSTMHTRTGDPMGINSISPGPGAYNPGDGNKAKAPSFTMKGRHESTSQVNTAPYRDLPSTIGQGPKISLASRHATRDAENTPGPNYIPPALGADAPKVAMSYRHGEARDSRLDNPGPGAYDYKAQFGNEAPKSTMHSRNGDPMGINSISPGPAAYSPDYTTQKPRAPSATMHVRPKDKGPDSTPGYTDLGSTLTGPAWTIGLKENLGMIPV